MLKIIIAGFTILITTACSTAIGWTIYKNSKRKKEEIYNALSKDKKRNNDEVTYHCSLNEKFGYDIIKLQQPFLKEMLENERKKAEAENLRKRTFTRREDDKKTTGPLSGSSIHTETPEDTNAKSDTNADDGISNTERKDTQATAKPTHKEKRPAATATKTPEPTEQEKPKAMPDERTEEQKKAQRNAVNFNDNFDDELFNFTEEDEIGIDQLTTNPDIYESITSNDNDSSDSAEPDSDKKTDEPANNKISDPKGYYDIMIKELEGKFDEMMKNEEKPDIGDETKQFVETQKNIAERKENV